MIKQIVLLTNA